MLVRIYVIKPLRARRGFDEADYIGVKMADDAIITASPIPIQRVINCKAERNGKASYRILDSLFAEEALATIKDKARKA